MNLPLQNFTSLLQTMAASVQGAANALLDLTVGSTLRAILEANAAIGLWMQWLIVQVLGVTRAATSQGADLDSWVNDYDLFRLPAAVAVGVVTMSRYTPTLAAFVPVGTQIRSSDGSQIFAITAAPSNTAWSTNLGGYQIVAGIAGADVPVAALAAGAAGNISAGTATVLSSAIAGIDSVTNAAPFTNGLDAESDAALRARFANYIGSLSKGTILAVATAIDSVRTGLTYVIGENMDAAGNTAPGSFLVTIDDGSGMPAVSLLTSVAQAIDAVRPIGSVFSVRAPVIVTATVALTLGLSDPTQHAACVMIVSAAITNYIDALPVGLPLAWSRLAQIAYSASALVTNVTNLTLNGGTSDLVVLPYSVIKAGSVTVQ